MLYEREKPEHKRKPLFSMDIEGIKRLILTKLSTFISKDNCICMNGAGIHKDIIFNKDYHIVYDSIVISEISDLLQERGKYIATGSLNADFKNEEGNVFCGITRRYSADIIIKENENHEAEITKLIKFVLSAA